MASTFVFYKVMNIKRIFGALLTLLGICGLIYAGVLFVNTSGGSTHNTKALVIYGILGIIFLAAASSLVRVTKDES